MASACRLHVGRPGRHGGRQVVTPDCAISAVPHARRYRASRAASRLSTNTIRRNEEWKNEARKPRYGHVATRYTAPTCVMRRYRPDYALFPLFPRFPARLSNLILFRKFR